MTFEGSRANTACRHEGQAGGGAAMRGGRQGQQGPGRGGGADMRGADTRGAGIALHCIACLAVQQRRREVL